MHRTRIERGAERYGIHQSILATEASDCATSDTIDAPIESCTVTRKRPTILSFQDDSSDVVWTSHAREPTMSKRTSSIVRLASVTTRRLSTTHLQNEQARITWSQGCDENYPLVR